MSRRSISQDYFYLVRQVKIHDNLTALATTPYAETLSAIEDGQLSSNLLSSPACLVSPESHPQNRDSTGNPYQFFNFEDIETERMLGRGGFGSVYLGTYKRCRVVYKKFHFQGNDDLIRETYMRELRALHLKLEHANVVALLGAATSTLGHKEGAYIMMQYAGSMSLQSYIELSDTVITLDHMLFFCTDITEGLNYLHSRNILHLDLKPANCILNLEEPAVLLCDFGTVHVVGEPWESQIEGTVAFRAPELFVCGGLPAYSSDIYSLGIMMWCFDACEFPYYDLPRELIIFRTVEHNLRPPVPALTTETSSLLQQFRDLYTKCWSGAPSDRPSLKKVIEVIDQITDDIQVIG